MPAKTREELLAQAAAKHAEAKGILDSAGENFGPEQETKMRGLLAEYDQLVAQAELLGRVAAGDAFLNEPDGLGASHLGFRASAPDEGNPAVDTKSWRSIKVETQVGEKEIRYHIPLAVQKKEYPGAFEAYMRFGVGKLGPNDRKTLTEGVDNAGGFLVPEEYYAEIIKKVIGLTAIRPNARAVQISRDVAKWPRVNYTADNIYTSGVRLTWTGESPASSTTHRVTDPVFGLYVIPVHTSMASMPLSNDLIEDSAFDVIGVSADLIAEAFALGEDDAFINGNGAARPQGIVSQVDGNGPASVNRASGGTVSASDYIDLFYTLPAQYRMKGKWYTNSATMKATEKLTDSYGRYIVSSLINGASLQSPQYDTIKGKPVLIDEFVPDLAAGAYPLIFGDLSAYLIADRVGLSVQRLSELYAETNVTLLLARKRVGGQLVEPWRVKVLKD